VESLASPAGTLPRFGDLRHAERIPAGARVAPGELWAPLAGYLAWRGTDAGVVVDLAAHSDVHWGGTTSSIAWFDSTGEHGAYLRNGAYHWRCPDFAAGRRVSDLPEVGVEWETREAGLRRARIALRYPTGAGVERRISVQPGRIELRDRLDVSDPAACRMEVDAGVEVEGAALRGTELVPRGSRIGTTVAVAGDLLAALPVAGQLQPFEQVRVTRDDPFWARWRRLGQRVRSPGLPGIALAAGVVASCTGWALARRSRRGGLAARLGWAVAFVSAGAVLALVLIGACV
jgi:hypothetical protein